MVEPDYDEEDGFEDADLGAEESDETEPEDKKKTRLDRIFKRKG